jgi:hypothetical protein
MELFAHLDTALAVLAGIAAVAKLTAWGRANAQALATVTETIEDLQRTDVKQEVAKRQADLSEVAKDALDDAVHTVDRKKKALPPALRVCREALRGLFTVRW